MKKSVLGFVALAAVALTCGTCAAFSMRASYGRPVLARDLVAPMAHERAEAERLGMRVVRQGVERHADHEWKLALSVRADECIALIVGLTGLAKAHDLALEDERGRKLAGVLPAGTSHVAQVQWCARRATRVRATMSLAAEFDDGDPELHWVLASGRRGPALDERSLTRNTIVDPEVRAAFEREEDAVAVARHQTRARTTEVTQVPDATERSAPLRIDLRSAVLLPPERTTFLALQRALMTRDAFPTLAPYFDPVPPWLPQAGPLPANVGSPSASLLRVRGGWERVLAAVDLDALGPACVALTFARLAEPEPDSAVVRVAIPTLARTNLVERDGVWSDRVCPASGLFLYTIPASAAAAYDVRIHSVPGARAHRRHSPWDGELLVSEERAELVARCAEFVNAPWACLGLARALDRDGAASAQVDRAFERACAVGNPSACGQLATRLFARGAPGDLERVTALERAACADRDWVSCAHRATRLRLVADDTTDDLVEARRLYGRACIEGHSSAACTNESQMERLQLGDP